VKGIQVSSNNGDNPSPRGDNGKRVKNTLKIFYTPCNEVRGVYWNQSVCLSVDTNLYLLLLLGLCMDFDETLHTCYK
jgi:hypothetical protein